MATKGMLSGLFAPQAIDPEEAAEEKRLQSLAAMDPFQAARYTALAGGAQAGQGIGKIAAAATGRDVRTPMAKRTDAIEAAKAQVAQMGFNPDDPDSIDKFYKQVVMILQKQGLAGEALDVAKEWADQKTAAKRAATADAESARKAAKDAASDARAKERNEILRKNGVPEFAKYVQMIEDATDPATRQLYTQRVNEMLGKAGKGIKIADLGDKVQIVDAATGAPIGAAMDKGAAPMNEKDAAKADEKETAQAAAYRNAMSALQNTYDAAVRLYNHSGVEGITGRWGRLVGSTGASGDTGVIREGATTFASADSRAALALWKQVTGSTFLEGLNQLKAASPVGSTGLGQVSNIEGEKVQSAAAALSREQDAPDFRLNLKVYLGKLADAAKALAAAAPIDKVTPIPLNEKPLTGPTASRPRPAAAPAAAPAPAAGGWAIKKKVP